MDDYERQGIFNILQSNEVEIDQKLYELTFPWATDPDRADHADAYRKRINQLDAENNAICDVLGMTRTWTYEID